MSDAAESKPKSGGCLSKLFGLFLLLIIGGIGAGVYFVTQPQDLSDLGGYGPAALATPSRNDMMATLKAGIDKDYPVTLTETDLNVWLAKTLQAKQGGMLASQVSLERVWVRLQEGYAEIIMERKAFGRPFTVSMFMQVERMQEANGAVTEIRLFGPPFHSSVPAVPEGGRFGKLVIPQGFVRAVQPAFEKLAAQFPDERKLFEQMRKIEIKKGALVLDPREPLGGAGIPGTF